MNLVRYVLPKNEFRKLKSEYQNLDCLQIRMICICSFCKDNVEQIHMIPVLKLPIRKRSSSHIKRRGVYPDGEKTENQYSPSAQRLGAVKKGSSQKLVSRNRKSQKPRGTFDHSENIH